MHRTKRGFLRSAREVLQLYATYLDSKSESILAEHMCCMSQISIQVARTQ